MLTNLTVFGIPRSGSTLIRNIVKEFDGGLSIQHHTYRDEDECKNIIVTYRDFRDCIASNWRNSLGENCFDSFINIVYPRFESHEFQDILLKHKLDYIPALYKYKQLDDKRHNVLLLKYCLFYNNFDFIFNELEKFLDIEIDKEKRKEIYDKWNINVVKEKYSNVLGKHDAWDRVTGFHGMHIMTGEPEIWMKLIEKKDWIKITKVLYTELKDWNYLDDNMYEMIEKYSAEEHWKDVMCRANIKIQKRKE